ncbi:MAG: phosphoserine phosphatase SerB [Candidatus Micropelagos thuwalensis]
MNKKPYYLVLTCNPASPVLTNELVARISLHLGEQEETVTCLNEGVAYEIPLNISTLEFENKITALRENFSDLPVDFNLVSSEGRRKKLLIADMESTIIEQECLDELADRLNLRNKISDITSRAMRGEIDFEPALRERVALLAGLPATSLQDVHDDVTLMPGAATLLATLKQNNVFCGLVSGGFSFFADKIAAQLNFDACHCNQLEIEADHLTGKVIDPILGREAKAARLQSWCDEKNLPAAETLAVGDGSNDLDMLKLSGMGVAFRAKPLVADAADFSIVNGDLTALLYLQGYQAEEIQFKS